MDYTLLIPPILLIFLVLSVGLLIGSIGTLIVISKEHKETQKELDKFRALYFNELDKWKNKYSNDDYEAY
jgi:hypothetical protein